jgi:hypothetical protein
MSSSPPPPRGTPPERPELRDTLLTFGPAIVVAFVLEWSLVNSAGWPPRRALVTAIVVGIAVAVLVQRSLRRRGGG